MLRSYQGRKCIHRTCSAIPHTAIYPSITPFCKILEITGLTSVFTRLLEEALAAFPFFFLPWADSITSTEGLGAKEDRASCQSHSKSSSSLGYERGIFPYKTSINFCPISQALLIKNLEDRETIISVK